MLLDPVARSTDNADSCVFYEDFSDRCYQPSEDAPSSTSDFWKTEDGKLIDQYMNCVENLEIWEEEQMEEAKQGHGAN